MTDLVALASRQLLHEGIAQVDLARVVLKAVIEGLLVRGARMDLGVVEQETRGIRHSSSGSSSGRGGGKVTHLRGGLLLLLLLLRLLATAAAAEHGVGSGTDDAMAHRTAHPEGHALDDVSHHAAHHAAPLLLLGHCRRGRRGARSRRRSRGGSLAAMVQARTSQMVRKIYRSLTEHTYRAGGAAGRRGAGAARR